MKLGKATPNCMVYGEAGKMPLQLYVLLLDKGFRRQRSKNIKKNVQNYFVITMGASGKVSLCTSTSVQTDRQKISPDGRFWEG